LRTGCLAVLAMSLSAPAAGTGTPSPPNIVFILADDLGYGDVACLNPERGRIPTPNLDRLAAEGLVFTDAHSGSAVCTPTRYGVLTGRYAWRTRLQSGVLEPFGSPLISKDRLTVASLLKRRGYHTICIGKWHLGWAWPGCRSDLVGLPGAGTSPPATAEQKNAWASVFSKSIPEGPTDRGFDEYFGTDVPNWPPFCFIENDRTVGVPSDWLPSEWLRVDPVYRHRLWASQPGPAVPGWRFEPILPTLVERACLAIARRAATGSPFFLYLALTSPHTPLAVNAEWRGRSGLNAYADFVMETDAAVGRVLGAIEASGAAADTLVIFTSDNGCAPYVGADELERKGHYPSGPFRGYKGDAWEGGHRVPFLVRWPKVVPAGRRCAETIWVGDLMATCAEIIGEALPAGAGEDSVSLLPLLKGRDRSIHEAVVHHSAGGRFAIRQGRWKLLLCPGSGGPWTRPTDPVATRQGLPVIQLYDLEADPGETTNLHDRHPDVVERLTALLERYVREGRSTPGPPQKNDVPVDWRGSGRRGAGG